MRLFHKGILLVAIPIIGQFIFVLVLVGAYRASEELAWQDIHYRTQTQELMGTSVLLYKSLSCLSSYGVTGREEFLTAFDRQYEQLVRNAELLSLLDHDHPASASKEAAQGLRKVLADLYSGRQLLSIKREPSARRQTQLAMLVEIQGDLSDSLSATEKVLAERARIGVSDVTQVERSRWIFLVSVIGGFALNMLISAGLLFAYARNFGQRFSVVLDNTARVTAGKALNPRITGTDEIGDLDRVFHEMNAAMKEAEARKEQFVSMVSHDVRSPLTSIQLTLELVGNKLYGDISELAREKLLETERSVRRLSRLVTDVLDSDKLKAGKLPLTMDMVPLDGLIRNCVKELDTAATAGAVTLSVIPSDISVIADRERISEVIINLVANAIKFSPVDTIIQIACVDEGEIARVTIADQGRGVPQEYRETIFLPFEQVPDEKRSKGASTGLGLSICKMLVELHGGQIGVEPGASSGSVFWFTLPIAQVDEL